MPPRPSITQGPNCGSRTSPAIRLAAVETLGAATIVFTDKTGTRTENRMAVRRIVTASGEVEVGGGAFETSGEVRRGGAPIDALGDRFTKRF